MLQRRLQPFHPVSNLRLHILRAPTVDVLGVRDEDVYEEYGFKPRSMQYNFFAEAAKSSFAAVLYDPRESPPSTLTSDNVVVRLFGSVTGSDVVVWYLGARKMHPLNDSSKGSRWGVFGIGKDSTSSKVRWVTEAGKKLTKRNSEAQVTGSPNPYALQILVQVAHTFGAAFVAQHPEMPCAKLFDAGYDHTTHPATLLLYRALAFSKPPGLDHYAWNALVHPPLERSHASALERMGHGLPVVG